MLLVFIMRWHSFPSLSLSLFLSIPLESRPSHVKHIAFCKPVSLHQNDYNHLIYDHNSIPFVRLMLFQFDLKYIWFIVSPLAVQSFHSMIRGITCPWPFRWNSVKLSTKLSLLEYKWLALAKSVHFMGIWFFVDAHRAKNPSIKYYLLTYLPSHRNRFLQLRAVIVAVVMLSHMVWRSKMIFSHARALAEQTYKNKRGWLIETYLPKCSFPFISSSFFASQFCKLFFLYSWSFVLFSFQFRVFLLLLTAN